MLTLKSSGRLPLYALLTANAVSWHGSAVTQVAVPWFVLRATGSPTLTGAVAAAGLGGNLLSLLLGAAVVDRLGYVRASVLADAFSAVSIALMPLLYAAGHLSITAVAVLAFTRGLLDATGGTARASLLPDLAVQGGVALEQANTLSEVAESGAGWTGPLLAGLLVAALGVQRVLWLDAASFLVSVALIGALAGNARRPAEPRGRWAPGGALDGWRFLWRDGPLRVIFASSLVFSSLMAALFAVVLPVFARRVGGPVGLGVIMSSFGLGAVLGALAFGRFGRRWSRRTTFLVGASGLAAIFFGLAFAPSVPWAAAACLLGGLVAGPNGPLIPTVLQERTPPALRARVFAASSALTLAAAPLGVLLGAVALERSGFRPALLGMTALFALGVLAASLDPGLREVDGWTAKP